MEAEREDIRRSALRLPFGMVLYARLIVVLTALALLMLVELAYVGNTPLQAGLWSPPDGRFGDFWHYRKLLELLHRPEFFAASDRFAYPAPCALVYQWLYHFGARPHVSFNLMLWATQGVSACLLLRALLKRRANLWQATGLVLLMAITSYPWHILYDRGNIEIVLYLLVAGGVWAWLNGYEAVAAVLWGCAGAMKLYPLLLLMMFTSRRNWRLFALGLASCVGLLLFSFWYVGPTIAVAAKGTMWGVRGFVGNYGAHVRFFSLGADHSLMAAMKSVLTLPMFPFTDQHILLSHIYEAAVVVLGLPAFLWWRRTAPPLNQLCLLLILIMLLPPVSYDYTLIYAYLVIGIVFCDYLTATARGEAYPGWKGYVVSFAILSTAENWVVVRGFLTNGLFKTGSLVAVAVLLIRYPLRRLVAPATPVSWHLRSRRLANA